MVNIDTHILWIEGRAEYFDHFDNDVFNYLSNEQGTSLRPAWQEILMFGNSDQKKRLLNVLQQIHPETQRAIFNLKTSKNERFPDRLAGFANSECLEVFFSILKNFSDEDIISLLVKEEGENGYNFSSLLASNPNGFRVMQPFYKFLQSLPALERLKFFHSKDRAGTSFAEIIASHQRGFFENGFQLFLDELVSIRKELKMNHETMAPDLALIDLFDHYDQVISFFKTVVRVQPTESIYRLFVNNWVESYQAKYFYKERENLWSLIINQPHASRVLILSDLSRNVGCFADLFCRFSGLSAPFLRRKWKQRIDQEYEKVDLLEQQAHLSCNSYQAITTALPVASIVSTDSHALPAVTENIRPVPSAPPFVDFKSISMEQEDEKAGFSVIHF